MPITIFCLNRLRLVLRKTYNFKILNLHKVESKIEAWIETAYRDRGMASLLSPAGGGHRQRNGGARWWSTKSATVFTRTSHRNHSILVLLLVRETWRLFGVGNGIRMPAMGSSGEAAGRHGGRQPAALAAKAVAAPTFANQSTGAGDRGITS